MQSYTSLGRFLNICAGSVYTGLEGVRVELLLARSSSHGVLVRRGTAQASYARSLCVLQIGSSMPEEGVSGRTAAFGTATVLDVVEVRSIDSLRDLGRDGSHLKIVSEVT
jgi:hypothetical protein